MRCKFFIAAIAALAVAVAAPPAAVAGPSLIAPPSACANQGRLDASFRVQLQVMRCMTDFARVRAGLEELSDTKALDRSARSKSRDILHCDEFSHFACGRKFTHWIRQTGYISVPCWRVGENLAWGTGEYGTVRSIFRAWMRSSGHRVNILGDFSQIGVSVKAGALGEMAGTRVWTQHFGTQCGGPYAAA